MTDALKQAAQQMLSAIPKIRFDSLNMTLKDLAEIRDAALVLRAALAAPAPAAPQAGAAGETVSCKHGVRLPHECSDCFDETDWYSPTTHAKRIADVMQLLCSGNRPSDAVVEAWLSNPDDCRLQEFAIEHGPSWAQGIAVIDAARVLADQPTEGVAHEFAPQPAAPQATATFSEPTVLPDGSAFATASWPLPSDHWLYAPRSEWDSTRDEYVECPHPILTHAQRESVTAAIRYAVRGATMCGKEADFDPDALVQNAVYALCGPFGKIAAPAPAQAVPLTDEQKTELARKYTGQNFPAIASPELWFLRGINEAERAHGIKQPGSEAC